MLPPLRDGTVLRERYRLVGVVGQGGMGSVYRAEDLRLPGRLCAIKEVQPDPSASIELQEQAQEQFLQEASILAQLDHPNLPKVSDYFSEGERDYIVMDYVPGKDLRQLVDECYDDNRWLEESLVLDWARQISDALFYLHQQLPPVLHRDIKPANIKLTPDNRIKLVDFGLVKVMASDEARTVTVLQGRGTALYTPLEQYGGDNGHTDVRSDVYAFGATLYNLLTNYPPPSAKERFLNPRALRPIQEINPDVSQVVNDVVMWAMEMHPDNRPESIQALRAALFDRSGVPSSDNAPQITLAGALQDNGALLALTAILLFIAFLFTLFG
ncbi:MAG: serine/threonine protein kinase [Anaerolineales bacterium]|nr:serine/threonine protein kinase [Anaerolineales bacterium]MCB0027036.1 serine/threonine protein kinase [Anaerolineales bacterium]